MATAGKTCIVEVEEIVPVGTIDPDDVHLPSVYVNKLIHGGSYEKRIEFQTLFKPGEAISVGGKPETREGRERMVKRAAREIKDGMYVNLGIGIPTLCANFLEPGVDITMQSENGILGLDRFPT